MDKTGFQIFTRSKIEVTKPNYSTKKKQSKPKHTFILQRSKFSHVNYVTHRLHCRYNCTLLSFPSIPVCLLVNEHLSHLARKFPEAKFVKAAVNSCIQRYHDRCLPTILVYKSGEIKARFIGVAECGGAYLKVEGKRNTCE